MSRSYSFLPLGSNQFSSSQRWVRQGIHPIFGFHHHITRFIKHAYFTALPTARLQIFINSIVKPESKAPTQVQQSPWKKKRKRDLDSGQTLKSQRESFTSTRKMILSKAMAYFNNQPLNKINFQRLTTLFTHNLPKIGIKN